MRIVVASCFALAACDAPRPTVVPVPENVASAAPATTAVASARPPTVDAGARPEIDPCDGTFPTRLADAQEALEVVAKARALATAKCATLRRRCTARPGGTAADCHGAPRDDQDFYEDTCMRWASNVLYDGSFTYVQGRHVQCDDGPASLVITEGTYDADVARIRGLHP